jgi:uncharacterized protein YbjT (DUF2867 family)
MRDANGQDGTTLVIGGTGKTGRRVVERLAARGMPVRVGSRAGTPPFDWNDRATWAPALHGISRVYVTYQPDLAVPGAAETVGNFARLAARSGVRRLVLLSGRGEEGARRAEDEVRNAGVEWTVLRASWFAQNFSESFLLDAVLAGEVALPADGVREPFVDADDIADAAVAALTEDGHAGRVYELTGPRALTFAEAVDEIARATGRPVRYVPIPAEAFIAGLSADGVPADVVWLMNELFTQVLDGRNTPLADGVQRALGRPPRDFTAYASAAASAGAWSAAR